MGLVCHCRLAIPLSAIALVTVALTAPPAAALFLMPPTALFVAAAVAIAAIVLLMPRAIAWLPRSRPLVRVFPSGYRDQASAGIMMAAGTWTYTLDVPNRSEADDALDLVRMDDDDGWQMPQPPA